MDDPHHQALIEGMDRPLACFAALPEHAREATRLCLEEMIDGMAAFLPAEDAARPARVCDSVDDLLAYCHVVAGTVGILLTRLFAQELGSAWMSEERMEDGRRFGLGLQLTNVLKDDSADRVRGVSYIPAHLTGTDGSLDTAHRPELVGVALDHLRSAQDYALSLPGERPELRLFCLWALHLALATLRLVREGAEPAKVSRDKVAAIVFEARHTAADDDALERLFAAYAGPLAG
jgi:farnesyl-diphosphate farnesyltransferase